MFIRTENCPVCNGVSIEQVDGLLVRPDEGWVYTSKILKKNKKDTLKITEVMQTCKCLVCGSYFFSPWFSGPDASNAFVTDISRHGYGWSNLQHALTSRSPNNPQQLTMLILKSVCGGSQVKRYGEIGCPFIGLNILSFSIENPSPFQRLVRFWRAGRKKLYPLGKFAVLVSDLFHNLGLFLSGLVMLAGSALRIFLKPGTHDYPESSSFSETEKYFLTTTTSYGWGSACGGFGLPCQQLASNLLGVTVVPLWDIEEDGFFDFIGIFNYFDHLSNPLLVLDRALLLARNVVITVHKPEYGGKQHRVVIGADFIDFLKSRYSAHDVELFEDPFDSFPDCDPYNVFVLRRKS